LPEVLILKPKSFGGNHDLFLKNSISEILHHIYYTIQANFYIILKKYFLLDVVESVISQFNTLSVDEFFSHFPADRTHEICIVTAVALMRGN
jgi:hypothetical protein